MQHTRRLVAIMFTDIQGYTKLMQQSESSAVAIRKRHREIFEPTTKEFQGEIIQYYGDGTLSIFNSTVNAVKCAGEMQKLFQQEPAIPVRIGIHTGDILVAEQDIIGDSVNLAARVESLAVPGSVLVSGKVADEIANQEELPLKRLGSFHFKNDRKERDVFALNWPGLVIPKGEILTGKLEHKKKKKKVDWQAYSWILSLIALFIFLGRTAFPYLENIRLNPPGEEQKLEKIESLAVLPLRSLTLGEEDRYLLDGIHEAIINQLNRAGMNVKPRLTMLSYRDKEIRPSQIASELGIQALVEGSLTRSGDSITIEINIINCQSEDYINTHDFKVDLKDILTLYKNLTKSIAEDIKQGLSQDIRDNLAIVEEVDPDAYEWYLKGRHEANKGTDLKLALSHFERAVKIDETFGPGYTGQVECHLLMGFGQISSRKAHQQFRLVADKALEYDKSISSNHHLKAMIYIFTDWNWKKAEEELKLARKAEPNSSSLYDTFCQFYWATGDLEKSVEYGEMAIDFGPEDHFAHCDLTWAYYMNDEVDKAKSLLDTTIRKFGDKCVYHRILKYNIPLETTRNDKEIRAFIDSVEQSQSLLPQKDWLAYSAIGQAYARLHNRQKALEYLGKAYKIEPKGFMGRGGEKVIYAQLGDKKKFFELMNADFLSHSFTLMYTIKTSTNFDPMRKYPEYDSILADMNLLHPFGKE